MKNHITVFKTAAFNHSAISHWTYAMHEMLPKTRKKKEKDWNLKQTMKLVPKYLKYKKGTNQNKKS